MIPLGDGRRRFGFPWMTSLLLALGLVLFFLGKLPTVSAYFSGYWLSLDPNYPPLGPLRLLWRALVAVLLPGPAWMWLEPIACLLYFWVLARKMEDACGPWGLLLLGMLGGIGGTAAQIALFPLTHFLENYPWAAYGLAGVVACLFGAYAVVYRLQPIRAFVPPVSTPQVPVLLHLLWWAGWTFLNVRWEAVIGLRPLEAFSLEPNWPSLVALPIGLLAGHLFVRREFLWLRWREAQARPRGRR